MATDDLGGGSFVGRQSELRLLLKAVAASRKARGSLVFVTGEAGVGKTRLVTEAVGHAQASGASVAWGYGRQAGGGALGPWREVVARLGVPIEELAADARGDAERLYASVATAIGRAAAAGPLLVVLEDVQWFDDQSMRLFEWIRPGFGELGAAVIATARTDSSSVGRPDHHVRLTGLTPDEVAALVAAHTDAALDADDLCRRTGGNPLFVLEVAREAPGRIPRSVAEVVRQRLEGLGDQALTIVRAASVLGETTDADVLARTSGLEGRTFDEALDEATDHRFLTRHSGDDLVRFQHEIVRDAVFDSIERPLRRRLHAAAARAGAGSGADPASIASHLIAAVSEVDHAEVARWAEVAGARAARLCAYDEAARWFDNARRRAAAGSADAIRLRLRGADARWRAGDRSTAWSEYETAAAEAEAIGDAALLAEAALGFGGGRAGFEVSPTHRAQRRVLAAALDALPENEHALRALLLSRLSITLSFEGAPDRQRDLARRAVDEARRSSSRAALVTALAGSCDAHGAAEHVHRRLATADEMVAAAEDDPELELLGLRFRIVALLELGDRTAVERAVQRFAELAAELRQPGITFFVPLFRAALAFADGRVRDAIRLNEDAAAVASTAESDNGMILTTSQRFAIALDEGRAAEVHDMLRDVAEQRPEITGPQAGLALAESHLGMTASARTRLDHLLANDLDAFPRDAEWLAVLASLAETAIRSRAVAAAKRLLPHLLPHGDLFAVDGIGASVLGTASYFAGRLASLAGDDAAGEELLRSARHACGGFRAPLLVAKCTWALAEACAVRSPSTAAELRSEALSMLNELGLPVVHVWPPPASDSPRVEPAELDAPSTAGPRAAMRLDGEVWTVEWRGGEARLRDTKGLRYLRELLARPGQEVHVLDLAAPYADGCRQDGDLGPMVDDAARAAYRRRIADLRDDIDEATQRNDFGRAEAAEAELEQLLHHLATAVGLGGRERRPGSATERARVNVTKSIKQALDRVDSHLPALGHHLRTTVRTGTFCVYQPDPTDPPRWDLA